MPVLTSSQRGGLYVTSWGTLKILVVFAKTKDDNDNTFNGWPLNSTPDWLSQFLDSQPNYTGQFTYNNYSQYFWEMSNGNFQVIGDIYPGFYISQKNEEEYANIQELNEEVLTAIDPFVDYSDYDNWRKDSNYNHTNVPDGNVDFIMIIYRALSETFFNITGSASLKLNNSLSFDGVTIKKGFPGSGLQQKSAMVGFDYTKYVAAHEFGHYLFGGGHTGPGAKLTLMDGGHHAAWYPMRGMCSWERERLSCIDYNEIQTTGSINVTLSDYMTTGDVIKINTGNTGEYFLLENRQGFSIHDQAADHGLYILHITNGDHSMATIDIECADGNWNFLFDGSTQTLTRDTEVRSGKDEVNFYTYHGENKIICRQPYYPADDAWGDNEDAFSMDFNPIFTPWSNPNNINSGYIDFTLEIFNENNNLMQTNINFYDLEAHAPFRPLNFDASVIDIIPELSWDMNNETDFSHYEIWKKNSPTSAWNLYVNNHTTTNFTDNSNMYPEVSYKVLAVDNDGKKSIFTKEINLTPGRVTENTTINGTVTLNFDLTIDPSVTLTMTSGLQLQFAAGKKLTVENGATLDADDATFTSTGATGVNQWQGLEIYGDADIENCTIQYANKALDFKEGATGTVKSNTIHTNY